MTAALVGLSHSPLIGRNDPHPDVLARVDGAIGAARKFVAEFDPELVVLYAPDHYNGFFYKEMPPFCLGTGAEAIGDFGSASGVLSVDGTAANRIAQHVLAQDIDLTISARMIVDHGFAQPLQTLFGGIDTVPLVPVFINGVATPLGPMRRIRALGNAIGVAARELGRRVLFVASGGLSHDPPVPVLEGAPAKVAEALINGVPPTPEQRERGEARVIAAGREYATGSTQMLPINPAWDNRVLDRLQDRDLTAFDDWTVDEMTGSGGGSAHEIRTWLAAFASLAAAGDYAVSHRFYEPIPAWIAGFAVMTAGLENGAQ
ncbi:3-(2,3-dihydroxyphenyl)propionate dioxygenase [Mycolicibacterium mucogenicum]|uniref:2,3-dihydroxyphenylpropionate/2,3-dihydroxicinnamic acid 1,2-dioxygenase n=1 Tax=Mycolicibacterium mucogenicum TaxID=56689 RepID=A0A1A3GNA6_MYCMU|nr:3-carboxyethylcatechol 2,3-dioxygenase [Mycolicibacterium mucogenicum]OBJ37522.1 3-(2,3-dihydroxyphenyl)propionate dioxygenase [Mycolicibacterium mucogenicum]